MRTQMCTNSDTNIISVLENTIYYNLIDQYCSLFNDPLTCTAGDRIEYKKELQGVKNQLQENANQVQENTNELRELAKGIAGTVSTSGT